MTAIESWQRPTLNENLHSTAKTEDEVKSGLLLDVVVGKGATVLKLLAGEDETLLIGRDALLVLNPEDSKRSALKDSMWSSQN